MATDLDAQVAVEVMGWHLVDWDQEPLCDPNGEPVEGGARWVNADGSYTGWCGWNWFPSEDVSAAFSVVAAMQARGMYCQITYEWEPGYGVQVYFDRQGVADAHPLYGARAATVPLAICEAALNAVRDIVQPSTPVQLAYRQYLIDSDRMDATIIRVAKGVVSGRLSMDALRIVVDEREALEGVPLRSTVGREG